MKYFLLVLLTPVLMSETCKKKSNAGTDEAGTGAIPICVQQKIDSIKAMPKWSPPAEINEYSYKGKKVYLFSSDCCDFYNPVTDDNCNYICAPNGGFTGRGDGKCPDFDSTAKHVRLVWKDPR